MTLNGSIQGSLLALTYLLVDSGAWIGAGLTAIGLCFVVIGVSAAHIRSLGYLYCYAALLSIWAFLAVLHVIIILGLITISKNLISPVLLVGQKIIENASHPFKTAVSAFYGVHAVSCCISIMCIICLRVATIDPVSKFDIQNPKGRLESIRHSLHHHSLGQIDGSNSNSSSNSNITSRCNKGISQLSQRLLGLGQAAVAPLESTNTGQDKPREFANMHEPHYQERPPSCKVREPQHGHEKDRRTLSMDSNVSHLPQEERVPQIVITLEDDGACEFLSNRAPNTAAAPLSIELKSDTTNRDITIYIPDQHYDLGNSLLEGSSKPSDTIHETIQSGKSVKTTPKDDVYIGSAEQPLTKIKSDKLEHIIEGFEYISPGLSNITTLDGIPRQNQVQNYQCLHNDYEFPSSKSYIPVLDSGTSTETEMPTNLQQRRQLQQKNQELNQQKSIRTSHGNESSYTLKPSSRPATPIRQSSISQQRLYKIGEDDEIEFDTEDRSQNYNRRICGQRPAIQVNFTDTHIYLINNGRNGDNVELPQSTNEQRLDIIPLQYRQERINGDYTFTENEIIPITSIKGRDSMASSTSGLANIASMFSKTKKQGPANVCNSSSSSNRKPLGTFVIPTIIIYPDEEENKAARVLSERDIEYLSMMPPVPLRPLIQPWEDAGHDNDHYDEAADDGYSIEEYDMYGHEKSRIELDNENELRQQRQQQRQQEYQHHHQRLQEHATIDGEFDPYALDVPINLEIDLNGLTHGDMITTL
ncbi:hypothetical protein BX616_005526 [Lobosporangium transversale]|nr:hypothetical protein BX616_005526 [Lobosporangium transversale]